MTSWHETSGSFAPVERAGVAGIPLWDKDGRIVDWAIVDAKNADELGELRWHRTAYGYASSQFRSVKILMHRIILDLWPRDGVDADHINGNRLDNRESNLRRATRAENRQNTGARKNSTSQHRGVCLAPNGKWIAQARCGGVSFSKRFATEIEAAEAVAAWRAEHMPFSEDAR